jgi:predicted amidohydrolase YtcJ
MRYFQNVHAIGDRANTLVLDAFESALEGINVTALRPRLEHAQIIRHSDMARLAKLGGMWLHPNAFPLDLVLILCHNPVIASVQPTHA